ncbi:MAG TPA: branched-chain amino acid ABC transporter permease [Baekduia sp.]
MSVLLQQLFNGIVNGSVYCLVAIGITLIFGLTGLVNFAHGEFMMVGAYIMLALASAQGAWAAFLLALVVALVGLGMFGVTLERTLFTRTLSRPINGFVVSLGLILVLQNAVALHWGTNPQVVTPPLTSSFSLGPVEVSSMRLLVLVVALLLCAAFYLFLNRTRVGTAMRCVNIDRDTATLMGVNVPRMQSLAFGVGSALAGGGGALLATIYTFSPFFGSTIVVKGFVISLAGGIGNVAGAFWAAMLFGICEALIVQVGLGAWSGALTFGFIIALLMVKPDGLFKGSHGSAVT